MAPARGPETNGGGMSRHLTADTALQVARAAANECAEDDTNGPQWQLLLAFQELDKIISNGGALPAEWQAGHSPPVKPLPLKELVELNPDFDERQLRRLQAFEQLLAEDDQACGYQDPEG